MKSILLLLLAIVALPAHAGEATNPDHQLVYQLAAQPLALVDGDKCHIRGAVWAYGPRAGVNVEVLDGDNIWTATTNAAGIFALSIPFSGRDIALIERPADPIFVRNEVANQARLFKPAMVCSTDITRQILANQHNPRSK